VQEEKITFARNYWVFARRCAIGKQTSRFQKPVEILGYFVKKKRTSLDRGRDRATFARIGVVVDGEKNDREPKTALSLKQKREA